MSVKSVLVCTLVLFLGGSNVSSVLSWSNGGYSSDPYQPKYGTHDWIAQHALDWLPVEQKQFLVDDMSIFLYGTELPDNGGAPDGIGDTMKHHVYYFANHTLQDDSAAVRAQEEYGKASQYAESGDMANASKRLGAMTHYICDVAVFGHVMGTYSDWGVEIHHSDYEDYVKIRTTSYTGEFDQYLTFDGTLTRTSAYNATLVVAYDTTFSPEDGCTCTWMDQNYNWSDPAFKDRCGKSLNLAANLIADVLYTFHAEVIVSEFPSTLILSSFILATLIVAIAYRRKHGAR